MGPSLILLAADYTKLLHLGADELIRQAEEQKEKIRFTDKDSADRFRYYQAVISAFQAMKTLGRRYSCLLYTSTVSILTPALALPGVTTNRKKGQFVLKTRALVKGTNRKEVSE